MALPAFFPEMEYQKQAPPGRKKREHDHEERKQKPKQTQQERPKQTQEERPRPKQTQEERPKQKQTQEERPKQKQKQKKNEKKEKEKPPSSWDHFKNLLTCKQMEGSRVHDPSKAALHRGRALYVHPAASKLGSSCGSICSFSDVAQGNTRVVHGADNLSVEDSFVSQETRLLSRKSGAQGSLSRSMTGSTRSSAAGTHYSSSRAMHFRKLSGCYECHMIVDPSRHPISPRICACSLCGEVFPKLESLELHQAVRHAVSELGPEDSGRNIVEIIFKSSWLKKDCPMYKIDRILKVHNTPRTIQRFEDCRDAVKARALQGPKRDARCAADGNELLRFHCTTLACSLGVRGSSSLCGSVPGCGVCTVIRHGFQGKPAGSGGDAKAVRTTACSGKAHDSIRCADTRRAMLVCRVIAGRVKRAGEGNGGSPQAEDHGGAYDSVTGQAGLYSNLDELFVFNPRAILPCFVVIYKVLES